MRTDEEALRACPVCGGPAENLGLRDYRWLNDALPGKEGATDVDGCVEKRGEIFCWEAKPWGISLPRGQQGFLRAMVKKGITIYVVWGPSPTGHYAWSKLRANGYLNGRVEGTLKEFRNTVVDWREEVLGK